VKTEGHEFFNFTGQVQAFEDVIFRMEIDNPGLRHNSFIRSLVFDLESELRLFSQNGVSYPVSSSNIYKKAQKAKLNMTAQARKKFLADARFFGTITTPKALNVLKVLSESYPKELLVGFFKHGQYFNYFREYPRVKHILGLSDAVDQAMSNFGMTVSFPTFKTGVVSPGQTHISNARIFSSVAIKPFAQIAFRFQRKSLRTRTRRFDLILHYLRTFPKNLEECEYVKVIKLSLTGAFSQNAEQELPKGFSELGIPLFPAVTQKKIDRVLSANREKRIQFYFNLQQSKALCSPVGEDMIENAYAQHFKSLCRDESETIPKDMELFEKIKTYGRKVGKEVNYLYDPYSTSYPNAKSSIEQNQLKGGNRSALKLNGTLTRFNSHPILGLSEGQVRLEPYVVGLFGPPASGKTTLVATLVHRLKQLLAPDMSREDFSYSRSCATKHWDGYNGQPVVILDDFGQGLDDRSDLAEFMTLVSINDYVLPMAELSEKGTKFTSPIIITTSNMQFGSKRVCGSSNGDVLEDPIALWRRFDLPLLVEKGVPLSVAQYAVEITSAQSMFYEKKHKTCTPLYVGNWPLSGRAANDMTITNNHTFVRKLMKCELARTIFAELNDKFDYHRLTFHDSWAQKIASKHVTYQKFQEGPIWDPLVQDIDNETCYPNAQRVYLDFPAHPPDHSPIVKAQALAEPLKVRMITVGECDTKVLQPLQMALFQYLTTKPQFCLTNGVKTLENFEDETLPWIYRIEEVIQRIRERSHLTENPLWLSGDYTAATDNFPMWATEALIEGILESIDHEPTKRWVRWEVSSHEMRYPKGVQGVQTSGQLMGSLLSFPLLCFLNDFVMQESGFDPLSYLVNGDDVVACDEIALIENWKKLAPRVGLSLSIGKNFIDPEFCTVNSQLFYNGNVLHTGKVSCQHRLGQTIGYTFQESQFYWGATPEIKENFLTRNWTVLKDTPRSLHFSTDHGGLGLVDTPKGFQFDAGLHKRVYLYDCLHRFSQVHRVPGAPFSFIAVPLLRGETAVEREGMHHSVSTFEKCQSLVDPDDRLTTSGDDLSHRELREFHKHMDKLHINLDVVRDGNYVLKHAPSRKFLGVEYLAITNGLAIRYSKASLKYAYQLIKKQWNEQSSVHPHEYLGSEDMLNDDGTELQALLDEISYLKENEDNFFQLLLDETEECIDPLSVEAKKLRKDVSDFWEPIERLESNDGGRLFKPRPQGFSALDEFLAVFGSSEDDSDTTNIKEQMLVDDLSGIITPL
jgi:hypothetical protein